MRIVVNHLTRMHRGAICVAGIDPETGAHVRPVVPGDALKRGMLASQGGPFDIAAVVDLPETMLIGKRPHVEDWRFEWWMAERLEYLSPAAFWAMLRDVARPTLSELFGDALRPQPAGNCVAVDAQASLGCLAPDERPELMLKPQQGGGWRIRLVLDYDGYWLDLPVTDLRLYGADGETPDVSRCRAVQERIEAGVELIVAVGLTRPFAKSEGGPEQHWLQVNNLHLADAPNWGVGR